MINELENPFSVTKATEFSDYEINEYWVNFNTEKEVSIESILNPSEFLPKYVIGGKGCGKTHILRYFSFPLQTIRYRGNAGKLLQNDKYIGLYSILGGLNSSRFKGKGINDSEWEAIFEYYFELYLCDSLLHTVKEIFSAIEVDEAIEGKLISNISTIFRSVQNQQIHSVDELIAFLHDLRNKIDLQILNAAFTRKLNYEEIKILFAPGDLLFGIPSFISNTVSEFNNVKFIFILDEYEKLFEWQKRFVNTLVWDKKTPVTFWIGARRHGYTTRETKSGENMKQGSEFQEVNLDIIIRSNENIYRRFAEKLCQNRLSKYYLQKSINLAPEEAYQKFKSRFDKYDETNLIEQLIERNKNKEFKHIKEFKKKLMEAVKNKTALNISTEEEVDKIIKEVQLHTENNPLDQKYKLFYVYKTWNSANKKEKFETIVDEMNKEYLSFKKNEKSLFKEIKDKRKKDFLTQLCKENNIKNPEYLGIEKFIELSQGNPRTFILILKKTIEFSKIRGEKPLDDGGSISLESQYLAVYDTARWFYEDVEVIGRSGKLMYESLKNLTDYMMIYRFCDKPTETTVSCFYIKGEELSNNTMDCIELMKMHSIIIEDDDGRLEKNTGRKERSFQINRILAPLWNLPIVERGTIYLAKEVAEAIFDPDYQNKFERLYDKRKKELNAPDFKLQSTDKPTSLF